MKSKEKLKLFICHSHEDDIQDFITHITPLKDNGLIEDWYDRKILAGSHFQNEIDNNLNDAGIICLFISANFLASNPCKDEIRKSLELRKTKGVAVIPIILSECGWKDWNEKTLSNLLALPTDGKPVKNWSDKNRAWHDVYEGLKKVIEQENEIKQLTITEKFSNFLQDAELLTKTHPKKEAILLDDIFVYPELAKYDELKEYEKDINTQNLIVDFIDTKLIIAGEDQSGKTSLCKIIFNELRRKNLLSVYICDKNKDLSGKIENRISKAFNEQYEQNDSKNIQLKDIPKERIVLIIDDFHYAKKKEKHVKDLSQYPCVILIVDDIFALNIKDNSLVNSFTHFKIKEYKPTLRNEVIKQWLQLTDKQSSEDNYQQIDQKTEIVNTTLGKVIGNGIMPSYPFFILSIISIQETFQKPLDQEITSQGYCYQAFIYIYLSKQGVRNDEIDTYINFLTEFAYYMFNKKAKDISKDDFDIFMENYLKKYQIPVEEKVLLRNLQQANLIIKDSFNNYSFGYEYIYYFFAAKYLAEHNEEKEKISDILNNLHKDENAYIAVFISHHSKNNDILDEIALNAMCLFDKFDIAALNKKEVAFFDKKADQIVQAVLPSSTTPEKERATRLENQDKTEANKTREVTSDDNLKDDDLGRELRRSIKTVEVMGRIIKNRAGSLEKRRLEQIFEEAMNVHLRILTSFFEIINKPENEQEIVDFIKERMEKILKEKNKNREINNEELKKLSKNIFWNMNFFTVFAIIQKVIHSLGSDKLTPIIKTVCDKTNTPASFIIEKGILMWYTKQLRVDDITSRIKDKDFSAIAKNIMKFQVVNHCLVHNINYKDRQTIENKMAIPHQKLIQKYDKD